MTTSRCSHLPEVLPDCTSSAAPMVKTVEDCSSLVNGQPQYVMQVSAKDGQLLSTVVRTLATQSPFNDRPMCRICHEGSSQEDLLSPCECTGTLGTIHRSCLEHWLSSSNTTYCELCHFRFSVERKPRPLVEWLRNPGPQHEKRTLFGDMVCFLFITPLATISGWLCLRGAVDHLHFSSRLEAVGLIALTVALFTIYLFWTLALEKPLMMASTLLMKCVTCNLFQYHLDITVDCIMNGVGPIKELYFSSQSLPASLQISSPCWACIRSKGTQRRQSSNCANPTPEP